MKRLFGINIIIGIVFLSSINAQTDIRAVDFNNFTYQPVCGGQNPLTYTVEDGKYFKETVVPVTLTKKQIKNGEPDTRTEREFFSVYQILYADLNGDADEEAIVLTVCTKTGPESFTEGFIYGLVNGSPELLARIEGGDRAAGGIRDVSFENGLIVVERSDPGDSIDPCCPEKIETTRYKYANKLIFPVGEKTLREIYPPTRIELSEETGQTSFDLAMPDPGQVKRFIIAGRKGRTLTVNATSEFGKIRLKKGKAKLEVNPQPLKNKVAYRATNTLVARLQETGDFVFEVNNFSNSQLNVTITVEIK